MIVLNNRILLYFCAYVWNGYMPEYIQAGTNFIYLFIVLHITDYPSASG
jgi:hypothetical protein